jgi:hypothetical protein
VDHISTGAATARHPDISRRSRRHTALTHVEGARGEIRRRSLRHEIPAEVGGYLSVSFSTQRAHGRKPPSVTPPAPCEQRRENR